MIPYNPSSFNSNKTILEQILELKNWLINHPQYEVYYCNDTALLSPVINSFSLADVPDNTNMDVGDLVVCNNAVYCTVISIDRDNGVFTAGYGISFKGDTGATGNDGKSIRVSSENYVNDSTAYSRANIQPVHSINQHDIVLFANDYIGYVSTISGVNFYVTATQNIKGDVGANGVSITNVTINASNHLIVTLSDGSTIDAGLINFSEEYVEVSTSSGTLSNDDRLKIIRGATLIYVDGNNKYYLEPYKYNNISQSIYYSNTRIESNVNEGGKVRATIHTITGNYAITIVSTNGKVVLAENIDSESQSNGKVLMANGSGGASWQTPSGGSIPAVTINESLSSGSMSLSDVTTLSNDGAVIVGSSYGRVYVKFQETSSMINFIYLSHSSNRIQVNSIRITKSSGAWSQYTELFDNNTLQSGSATNGQVLTADGNGGSSWQNAGGGLEIVNISGTSGTFSASDLAKLSGDNCIIVRTISTNVIVFRKTNSSSSRLYYRNDTAFTGQSTLIEIISATGVWSTNTYTIEGTSIASTGATSGQVLASNGDGTASWQNAGGSTLYCHYIHFEKTSVKLYGFATIISNSPTAYNYATFCSKLNNQNNSNPYRSILANGTITINSNTYNVIGIYAGTNSILSATYMLPDGTTNDETLGTSINAFNDVVVTL